MKKVKVLSTSKNEHRSQYSFSKDFDSLMAVRDILIELGFDEHEMIHYFDDMICDNLDLKNYYEETAGFYSDKYSVDLIFFKKKVNLIFNYKEDKQEEISEIINKFTSEI